MKKFFVWYHNNFFVIITVTLLVTSCTKVDRTFDSEISAIRDQTEVLKEQNKILTEIAKKQK